MADQGKRVSDCYCSDKRDDMRRLAVSLALVLQVSSIVLCSVLGPLQLGVWLDRMFGSAPWLTLILMVIGLGLAVFGTYRLAKRINE